MVDDAVIISLARGLYPALTTGAAPDAFFEAWIPWARAHAGSNFGAYQTHALAHLIAHIAYRVDPEGLLGSGGTSPGPVTSISTGALSASFGTVSGAAAGLYSASDAELSTTRAGMAYLALRATRSKIMLPRMV